GWTIAVSFHFAASRFRIAHSLPLETDCGGPASIVHHLPPIGGLRSPVFRLWSSVVCRHQAWKAARESTTRAAAAGAKGAAGAPGGGSRATANMPAARAAARPRGESSITRQAAGSAPSSAAARRKTSGAGLGRGTVSPLTTAAKKARTPRAASVTAIQRGGEV